MADPAPRMKVTILQRGGDKSDHGAIERAARFYASELMSNRLANTLSIRIELRASRLTGATHGACSSLADGSQATKEFTVILRRDDDRATKLEFLAHEMTHVAQKAQNRLQIRRWKTDGEFHVRWEGQDLGVWGAIPYMERPWEIEAYAQQEWLPGALLAYWRRWK